MESPPMQFTSLCSGIEGAAEIQPFCCDLLAKDGIYAYGIHAAHTGSVISHRI